MLLFSFSFPVSSIKKMYQKVENVQQSPLSANSLSSFFFLILLSLHVFLSLSGILVQSAMAIMLSRVIHVLFMQFLGLVYPFTPKTGYFWR